MANSYKTADFFSNKSEQKLHYKSINLIFHTQRPFINPNLFPFFLSRNSLLNENEIETAHDFTMKMC